MPQTSRSALCSGTRSITSLNPHLARPFAGSGTCRSQLRALWCRLGISAGPFAPFVSKLLLSGPSLASGAAASATHAFSAKAHGTAHDAANDTADDAAPADRDADTEAARDRVGNGDGACCGFRKRVSVQSCMRSHRLTLPPEPAGKYDKIAGALAWLFMFIAEFNDSRAQSKPWRKGGNHDRRSDVPSKP